MTKFRTTHPRYIPAPLWGAAVATCLIVFAVLIFVVARMLSHLA